MPDGRPMWLTRWYVRKTALTTIASVIAICSATRTAPARLRNRAERMGRSSMSEHLEVRGGRGTPDAPCGIEACHEAGGDRDGNADQEIGLVEWQHTCGFIHEASIPGAQRPDTAQSQQPADDAACERDHSRFGEVLPEDVAPTGAECTPHPGDGRRVQEFREQQSHSVHQANGEERERHREHGL